MSMLIRQEYIKASTLKSGNVSFTAADVPLQCHPVDYRLEIYKETDVKNNYLSYASDSY